MRIPPVGISDLGLIAGPLKPPFLVFHLTAFQLLAFCCKFCTLPSVNLPLTKHQVSQPTPPLNASGSSPVHQHATAVTAQSPRVELAHAVAWWCKARLKSLHATWRQRGCAEATRAPGKWHGQETRARNSAPSPLNVWCGRVSTMVRRRLSVPSRPPSALPPSPSRTCPATSPPRRVLRRPPPRAPPAP